ncbi:hypothetical protein [Helicobacter pylori]|uniref:hypothetical protein n=1 Tax=Helicobacter pylori TaxID=210 RepID=UPI0018F173FC|nr:hypothetical protein [Helicobacter pylori]
MRRKNETATSFNQLKEIMQAIQAQKNSVQTSENANASELTPKQALKPKNSAQTSENANASELTPKQALKPKNSAHAKNSALKPTKRAFSERQIATIRDNAQASAKESKEGVNA